VPLLLLLLLLLAGVAALRRAVRKEEVVVEGEEEEEEEEEEEAEALVTTLAPIARVLLVRGVQQLGLGLALGLLLLKKPGRVRCRPSVPPPLMVLNTLNPLFLFLVLLFSSDSSFVDSASTMIASAAWVASARATPAWSGAVPPIERPFPSSSFKPSSCSSSLFLVVCTAEGTPG
jgi:hypothetical protein